MQIKVTVSNSPYGLCRRKATLKSNFQRRPCCQPRDMVGLSPGRAIMLQPHVTQMVKTNANFNAQCKTRAHFQSGTETVTDQIKIK